MPTLTPAQAHLTPLEEDEALMARIASGDARAFRSLCDVHLRSILIYATRLLKSETEAQDVAQETFLKVWLNASKYRPQARATTWIHAIARNLIIDRLRGARAKATHFELDDERDQAPYSDRPSRLLEKKSTAEMVATAIASLPERQQSALLLCHEQGLSQQEIAHVLDCSIDAVESLLKRARATLKQKLETTELGLKEP